MTDTFERVDPGVANARQISKARRPASQVSRRQGLLWALGLLLVIGGALASLALVRAGDERIEILVMARDVPAGQQITADDLTVAEVASDDLAVLPVTQQNSVIGTYARVRILASQPVSTALVQSDPLITDGTVVIAIPVSTIDIPAGTREQSVVDLVVTDVGSSGGVAEAELFIARAVVVEFPSFADGGGRDSAAISVEVSPEDAPVLVAGLDDIAIVLVDPALDPTPDAEPVEADE